MWTESQRDSVSAKWENGRFIIHGGQVTYGVPDVWSYMVYDDQDEQFLDGTFATLEEAKAAAEAVPDDLREALDALDEVMSYDKGMGEEDWVEFCNRILPLMKRNGRQKYTAGWS